MTRRALITGITGQDGSYLAELLLTKGYEVHGLVRRASTENTSRIAHLSQCHHEGHRFKLHQGDLDSSRLAALVNQVQPTEVYNLAAQSNVRVSFEDPLGTLSTNSLGPIRILEAIRDAGVQCRFYQASTSEMFGSTPPPQSETSTFYPRSPYGAAKLLAHCVTRNYREAYGMFAVSGILFNHESPRRGAAFVTRKISKAVALIKSGQKHVLSLGNLDAVRDWGYAPEYVEGMWRMMQADVPRDYVLATGVGYSVRQFMEGAFAHAGLAWEEHVRFDAAHLRPTEADALVGDAGKALIELGWKAHTHGHELIQIMVDADIEALASEGRHWIDIPKVPWLRSLSSDA